MSKWKYADVEFANEYDEGKSTVVTADVPLCIHGPCPAQARRRVLAGD